MMNLSKLKQEIIGKKLMSIIGLKDFDEKLIINYKEAQIIDVKK